MSLSIRKLATLATMALAIAACGSDDDGGGNGPTPLTTPTNLVAQATSATAMQVDFATVTGATGYIIERAAGTGAFAVVSEPTANTFTDTGLLPSSTYRYRVAARSTDATIASLRGRRHSYGETPLVVTYHPAYLLRNLPDKAKAWEDLVFARRMASSVASADPPVA